MSAEDETLAAEVRPEEGGEDDGHIFVKVLTMDRNTYEFRVTKDMGVKDFKERVQEVSNIVVSRQRLIFRGKMLKDQDTLDMYQIENGHVLQLCARPLTAPSPTQSNSGESSDPIAGDSTTDNNRPVVIATQLGSALSGGGGVPLSRLRGEFARPESARMEHVWQGLLTLNTLMSTMTISTPPDTTLDWEGCPSSPNTSEDDEEDEETDADAADEVGELQQTRLASELASAFDENTNETEDAPSSSVSNTEDTKQGATSSENRKFFVGQWLDVKDTVNQWLEATILRMSRTRLYIHYNGWPARWDEWIRVDSDRIAPFRTKTLHPQTAPHVSPSPVSWVRDAPVAGPNDVRPLIASVENMILKTMPMISAFRDLCAASSRRTDENRQGSSRLGSIDEADEETATKEDTTSSGPSTDEEETKHISEDLRARASELAPLLDRLGRVISDLAPHVADVCRPDDARPTASSSSSSSSATTTTTTSPARPVDANVDRASEAPRPENSFMRLISTPSNSPHLVRQQGNVDIHIHAILTPWQNAMRAASRGTTSNGGGLDAAAAAPPSTSTMESTTNAIPGSSSNQPLPRSIGSSLMSMIQNRIHRRNVTTDPSGWIRPEGRGQARSEFDVFQRRRVAEETAEELREMRRRNNRNSGDSPRNDDRGADEENDDENDDDDGGGGDSEVPSGCAQQID